MTYQNPISEADLTGSGSFERRASLYDQAEAGVNPIRTTTTDGVTTILEAVQVELDDEPRTLFFERDEDADHISLVSGEDVVREYGIQLDIPLTEGGFYDWFAAVDLGGLEDVRGYVQDHALENSCDAANPWEGAQATVEFYLGDLRAAHDIFNHYRPTPIPYERTT